MASGGEAEPERPGAGLLTRALRIRVMTDDTSDKSRPDAQSFFERKASAPAAIPRLRSLSASRADTSTTGSPRVSGRLRSLRVKASPSIPIIMTSQTTTS